jgi:cell division protein FtsL
MTRVNVVLLIAVLASAIYLVRTQYESRRLFTEVDRAVSEAHKLEREHERPAGRKAAPGHAVRVEKLAKEQLQMRSARRPSRSTSRRGARRLRGAAH